MLSHPPEYTGQRTGVDLGKVLVYSSCYEKATRAIHQFVNQDS